MFQHIVDCGARSFDQLRVVRQPDKSHVEAYGKIIAGCSDLRVWMFDPVRVEAMHGNERGVKLAAFQSRKKFTASGHQMRDTGNEAAMIESHENGVAECAGFDRQI